MIHSSPEQLEQWLRAPEMVSAEESARIDLHLKSCNPCSAELEKLLQNPELNRWRDLLSQPTFTRIRLEASLKETPPPSGLVESADPAARYSFPRAADPQHLGRLGAFDMVKVLGQGAMGSVFLVVDAILTADEDAPPKQRHTAMQIFRRLCAEHSYAGGHERVRRYVARQCRDRRETFIPLAHDPGLRLEADLGHIHGDFPDGRRFVPVLVTAWVYSNCPFVMAMPTERTAAILAGRGPRSVCRAHEGGVRRRQLRRQAPGVGCARDT
jgi:hypothetical protein